MHLYGEVTEQYRDFARYAVDSPCFASWASRVAEDPAVLGWIGALPPVKQQPNLVFAAARWHGVEAPGPYDGLRSALLDDDGRIRETILSRSTQTNEVGRLATLAPVFARIAADSERPLALLEAGPSAGLCLYPDRYRYDYELVVEDRHARWLAGDGPTLACRVKGMFPVPQGGLDVAWRGGLDLHPLDVDDADAMAWLEMLIWPEQHERRQRLARAIEIARSDPPKIAQGDILSDLPGLVDEASTFGEVVVFHSAVVAYLEPDDRSRFNGLMTELVASDRCRWVSNEGKNVLPDVTATGPQIPDDHPTFVLALDGQVLAWTHGHGRSMTWHAH